MKKFISLFFAALFLMSICASSALADGDTTNYAFTFTAQCVNTSSLNHASSYHTKQGDCTIIEVRHSVSGNGSSAGYTNYIYAYIQDVGYYGAKWRAPDMIYHSCTSDYLWAGDSVTPGGRGNTKYNENLGLTSITITGQFRPH